MKRPTHSGPLLLKFLTPDQVREHINKDPRLIVPVGTTEQHGPHLPLGCDTIIVNRFAHDLSSEFQVLCAPTIEYGVNAATKTPYPGTASVTRKTLHRLMNDLVGTWEEGGIEQFIILTAHGQDPHQEALTTLRTNRATVRAVDVLSMPVDSAGADLVIHGGELDTSLLLYIDAGLARLEEARDYVPSRRSIRRYRRGSRDAIPVDSPGSLGTPTTASFEKGEQFYHLVYDRIATRLFHRVTSDE